ICFSISVGAAPGCDTMTETIGKLMSGFPLIAICLKLTIPRKVSTMNRTIGKVGLRIDQLEMLRIGSARLLRGGRDGLHGLARLQEAAGTLDHRLATVEARGDAQAAGVDRTNLD